MTIIKKGKYFYADSQKDIREELIRYSAMNDYPTTHYADAICKCGNKLFKLLSDDVGCAVRECAKCKNKHPIGDSGEYLGQTELVQHECVCGKKILKSPSVLPCMKIVKMSVGFTLVVGVQHAN